NKYWRSLRVGWQDRRVSREVVRPFGALIDPCLDGIDLLLAERAGSGHLWAVLAPDQFQVKPADCAVAGHDHGRGPAPHRVAAAVEPEAMHLLRWPVALNAVLLQERLNVATEIDLAGGLVR